MRFAFLLAEHRPILKLPVGLHLPMQMVAGGSAGAAHQSNGLTCRNGCALTDCNRGQMCIQGGGAAAVVNDHIIAVAFLEMA